MTWKEFKEFVEGSGVTDGMTIDYFDFGDSPLDSIEFIDDAGVETDSAHATAFRVV